MTHHHASTEPAATDLREHVVEIVSDSGEGAQKCAQSFAAIAARMGNGIWTVEIIPAEIKPPARSIAGASGNRIRVGSTRVTNGGDAADLVVALNEQVLLGRVRAGELRPGCTILLDSFWRGHEDESIRSAYTETFDRLVADGYDVHEVPMYEACRAVISEPGRGRNMFTLGLLTSIYSLDLDVAREQIARTFERKGGDTIETSRRLLEAGYAWARGSLPLRYRIPPAGFAKPQLVTNGNTALGMGVLAAGYEVCAMYPITPATSASHYLADVIENVGGAVHQAEDEIAAVCFAIGASYAGRCAITITSGPGFSLKQEAIGLAVMAEIPLVVVNVQRGGPSTGQPTKVEQGDLLTAVFGSHGDAPKVVLAASDIEDCFYSVITARRIAEMLNTVVVVLTDANLATAQQPFDRPEFDPAWLPPPIDPNSVPNEKPPYDWNDTSGLHPRFVPGQPGGMHTITGLAHDRASRVAYDPIVNEQGIRARSLKLAAFQKSLATPAVYGDEDGELLVVGWGSTRGAIEEAVRRVRADGHRVGALHLRFLQPMAGGIGDILRRYRKVLAVEINWCDRLEDELVDADNRRYTNLAWLLRARHLVDIDCWSEVRGQPIKPGAIEAALRDRLREESRA